MLDVKAIRALFPITEEKFPVVGSAELSPLIYLDHGASTHPAKPVLERYLHFIQHSYSNVHRGNHYLSRISTDYFEHVAEEVLDFIGADNAANTVILAGNTTGALDIAAHAMAPFAGATLVTVLEHHSNDLPHRRRGDVFHADVLDDGTLDYADVETKLRSHAIKLLAVTGASNVTGYMPDLGRLARLAHRYGAKILVDAAQLLAHKAIAVKPQGDPEHLDFLAAAGHKAYAPFGSAFLYGPRDILDAAPPYVPGGGTVTFVTDDEAYYAKSPDRHQGGTPNIAGAVALGTALEFLRSAGMEDIREHERRLTEYALREIGALEGVHVLGNVAPEQRLGVISVMFDDVPHDLAAWILNAEAAIATRNGCFCAQPYIQRLLGVNIRAIRSQLLAGEVIAAPGAVRATFGIYNTEREAAELVRMLKVIRDHAWRGTYDHAFAPHRLSLA